MALPPNRPLQFSHKCAGERLRSGEKGAGNTGQGSRIGSRGDAYCGGAYWRRGGVVGPRRLWWFGVVCVYGLCFWAANAVGAGEVAAVLVGAGDIASCGGKG